MGLPRLNQGVGRTVFLSGSSRQMHFLASVPFSIFQASIGRSNPRCNAIFHILTFLLSLLRLMTHIVPSGSDGKESACNAKHSGLDPWVRKIPWRRAWQPTPALLPGESHGQKSLVDYSPWGHKESDMTEAAEHTRARPQARDCTGTTVMTQAPLLILRSADKSFNPICYSASFHSSLQSEWISRTFLQSLREMGTSGIHWQTSFYCTSNTVLFFFI